MLIECPKCEAQYEVASADALVGRKVRCTDCTHVWMPIPHAPGSAEDGAPAVRAKPEAPAQGGDGATTAVADSAERKVVPPTPPKAPAAASDSGSGSAPAKPKPQKPTPPQQAAKTETDATPAPPPRPGEAKAESTAKADDTGSAQAPKRVTPPPPPKDDLASAKPSGPSDDADDLDASDDDNFGDDDAGDRWPAPAPVAPRPHVATAAGEGRPDVANPAPPPASGAGLSDRAAKARESQARANGWSSARYDDIGTHGERRAAYPSLSPDAGRETETDPRLGGPGRAPGHDSPFSRDHDALRGVLDEVTAEGNDDFGSAEPDMSDDYGTDDADAGGRDARSSRDTRPFTSDFDRPTDELAANARIRSKTGTPIRRRSGAARAMLALGWVGLLAITGGAATVVSMMPDAVTERVPAMTKFYRAVGRVQPAAQPPVRVASLRVRWFQSPATRTAEVRGRLINGTTEEIPSPALEFVIRDAGGAVLSIWTDKVHEGPIAAARSVPFSVRVPVPPDRAERIDVRLAASD